MWSEVSAWLLAALMTRPSIRRTNRSIPWGYTQNPDDNMLFDPLEDHLDAYDQAKEYIKQGCSYRDTAKWLSATTESFITHVGLFLKMKKEKKKVLSLRAKKASLMKYYPELFETDDA